MESALQVEIIMKWTVDTSSSTNLIHEGTYCVAELMKSNLEENFADKWRSVLSRHIDSLDSVSSQGCDIGRSCVVLMSWTVGVINLSRIDLLNEVILSRNGLAVLADQFFEYSQLSMQRIGILCAIAHICSMAHVGYLDGSSLRIAKALILFSNTVFCDEHVSKFVHALKVCLRALKPELNSDDIIEMGII